MNSSLMTLIAYLVVLTPLMLLGFYFARRKMFNPHHKLVMTSVVILNWILIGAVMANSYRLGVAPNIPDDIGQIRNLLPTIHLITGAIAQILATYLLIIMWTENTPLEWWFDIIRTKNIKPIMRTTLALWLITIVLGFGIYAVWNAPNSNAESETVQPVVTEEASDEAIEEATDDTSDEATEEATDETTSELPVLDSTEEVEDLAATEEAGD